MQELGKSHVPRLGLVPSFFLLSSLGGRRAATKDHLTQYLAKF